MTAVYGVMSESFNFSDAEPLLPIPKTDEQITIVDTLSAIVPEVIEVGQLTDTITSPISSSLVMSGSLTDTWTNGTNYGCRDEIITLVDLYTTVPDTKILGSINETFSITDTPLVIIDTALPISEIAVFQDHLIGYTITNQAYTYAPIGV